MRYLLTFTLLLISFYTLAVVNEELPCGPQCTEAIVDHALQGKTCGGTNGACRVFVSNEQLQGNMASSNSFCVGLTGMEGAECVCRLEGRGIDANREFKPWLSDNNITAPRRVELVAVHPYQRAREGQTMIGSGVNLLSVAQVKTANGHIHGIKILNSTISSTNTVVWTGTAAGGVSTGNQCGGNWLSTSGQISGTIGRAANDEIAWTDNGVQPCNSQASLYCFEVPTPVSVKPNRLTDWRQSEIELRANQFF